MLFRQKSKRKGFTLVELIITMVIIAIISVIAIPKMYSHYVSNKISSAAKIMLADIRYAQSKAMAEHDSTWVEFDESQNLYKLYSGATKATRTLDFNTFENSSFIRYLDQGDFKNVVITDLNIGDDNEIAFDWFGNTSNSGTIVLNNSTTITVEYSTGLVRIEDW